MAVVASPKRFWDRVEKGDPDECWHWRPAPNKRGYGVLTTWSGGKQTSEYAHRISYELSVGTIPEGLTIDHLCMNKRCVNPAHLEAVTGPINSRRWSQSITHCAHGHEYTEANTYVDSRNCRNCRGCRVDQARRRRKGTVAA